MDSFTIAVVVGMGVVLALLVGLVVLDRGAPEPTNPPRSRKK